MTEFIEFGKIARLSRNCTVTEKIDGTNACVFIGEDGEFLTGSRTRWITPEADNYGFAKWAQANKDALMQLGPGRHFGEWWGSGCQRGYGLPQGEKRFSLFNTSRWVPAGTTPERIQTKDPRVVKFQEVAPSCCHVVPVLYRGPFDTARIEATLTMLGATGSVAAPGFMQPEGIIIYHVAGGLYFKKTLEKDDEPKGKPQ